MSEINVHHAFDPEARYAQHNLDQYINSLPSVDGEPPYQPRRETVSKHQRIDERNDAVVLKRKQATKRDRIGRMLDDVRDNLDQARPPYATTYEGPEASLLRQRLFPDEYIQAVHTIAAEYEDGGVGRFVDHVGRRENGTFHPHYYYFDRSIPGKTRMFFVDPEHKVASKNFVRPSIVNLVGIDLSDDVLTSPQVAILRYQVPSYDPSNKQAALGPEKLRDVMGEVLDNNGELPESLSGSAEQKVLFALFANNHISRVQARYSTKKHINGFAKGQKGSSALEGKVQVQKYVLDKLVRIFSEPAKVRKLGARALDSVSSR